MVYEVTPQPVVDDGNATPVLDAVELSEEPPAVTVVLPIDGHPLDGVTVTDIVVGFATPMEPVDAQLTVHDDVVPPVTVGVPVVAVAVHEYVAPVTVATENTTPV